MKLFVYPYTTGSESAKLLAERLGALRIKLSNSNYTHLPSNLVINWGNSNCPYGGPQVLNQASAIAKTVNKLSFFRLMTRAGLAGYLVPYFTHPDDIPDEAFPVFCRTKVASCDGDGIVISDNRNQLVPADLYTSYVKDTAEYRVTVFKDEITDIQTKLPRVGQDAHPMVRTYANGWGFQRKSVPEVVYDKIVAAARAALAASGLDFAGVDVLYDTVKQRAYVLEVNTAMGLEGDALNRFAGAVERYAASLESPAPEPVQAAPAPVTPGGYEDSLLKAIADRDWLLLIQLSARQLEKEAA